jgi:hypothetical protein
VLAPLLVIGCAGEPDRIVIEYTMADGGTPAAPGGNKGGDLERNLGGHGGGRAPGVAGPALARKLCEGTLVAQATNLTLTFPAPRS